MTIYVFGSFDSRENNIHIIGYRFDFPNQIGMNAKYSVEPI